jgi:hypothetical protein
VSKSPNNINPTGPGTPSDYPQGPPKDNYRASDIVLVEIAKLQSDGEYTKRDLAAVREDVKDARDRIARLEVKVDHLPSKGFIVSALIAVLTIVGLLLAISPQLQRLAGTAGNSFVAPAANNTP